MEGVTGTRFRGAPGEEGLGEERRDRKFGVELTMFEMSITQLHGVCCKHLKMRSSVVEGRRLGWKHGCPQTDGI